MMTVWTNMRMGRKSGGLRRTSVGGILFVVVLAVVIPSDLPVIHVHDAPGFYDEDCPLERLAAAKPPVPPPPDLAMSKPVPVSAPVPTILSSASVDGAFASFESRAPPVRSA